MAAGLPPVVSDWNGYRDTVRHGVDGFRIATRTPAPGSGVDIAMRYALQWDSYDAYIGQAAQLCAVDVDEAADAIVRLIEDRELRARMAAAGQARARADFDWRAIIPRYQALWTELGEVRRTAPPTPQPRENPWRLDPFTFFGSYPTAWTCGTSRIALAPGATADAAVALLRSPAVTYARSALPSPAEATTIITRLQSGRPRTVDEVVAFGPPGRRPLLARSILWFAKFGLLRLLDPAGVAD
jgi:hypothetical protein